MSTTKYRINITLGRDTQAALMRTAKRDQVPAATKAAHLLELALDIEEDRLLEQIVAEREAEGGPYISHKDAWA